MAARKTTIDWARIELEYLAGEDSIREVADRQEISDTAIRKRAKAEGWIKPVRSANLREPRPSQPPPQPSDPAKPRDAGSIADDGRNLVARMLDELDTVTSHRGELEEMIYSDTRDDQNGGRREGLLKAISLPERAGTMKTLALALKTLNEASAPQGKKAAQQEKANAIGGASRFASLGPPTLKAVK